jgi:hypothetical protein
MTEQAPRQHLAETLFSMINTHDAWPRNGRPARAVNRHGRAQAESPGIDTLSHLDGDRAPAESRLDLGVRYAPVVGALPSSPRTEKR